MLLRLNGGVFVAGKFFPVAVLPQPVCCRRLKAELKGYFFLTQAFPRDGGEAAPDAVDIFTDSHAALIFEFTHKVAAIEPGQLFQCFQR